MLRKLIFITSVSLCFGLILQAAETVEGEGRIPMQQMAGQHQMHKITGRADTLQSARDLIGATIQNNNEVTIGTVKELEPASVGQMKHGAVAQSIPGTRVRSIQ